MENIDEAVLEQAMIALDDAEKLERSENWDKALFKYQTAMNHFAKSGLPAKKAREITDQITDRISEIMRFLESCKSQPQVVNSTACAQEEEIGIAALDEAAMLVQRKMYPEAMEKYMVAAQCLIQAGWGEKELGHIQKEVEKVQRLMAGGSAGQDEESMDDYTSPGMSQADIVYSGGNQRVANASTPAYQENEEYVPSFLQVGQGKNVNAQPKNYDDAQSVNWNQNQNQEYVPSFMQHSSPDYVQNNNQPNQAEQEYVPSFMQHDAQPTTNYQNKSQSGFGEAQPVEYVPSFMQHDANASNIVQPIQNQAPMNEEYVPSFLQNNQESQIPMNQSVHNQPEAAQIFQPSFLEFETNMYQPDVVEDLSNIGKVEPQEYVPSFMQVDSQQLPVQQNFNQVVPQASNEYVPSFLQTNQGDIVAPTSNSGSYQQEAEYKPTFLDAEPVNSQQPKPLSSSAGDGQFDPNAFANMMANLGKPKEAAPDTNEPMFAKIGQADYVPYQEKAANLDSNEPMFAKIGQGDYVPYQEKKTGLDANEPMFAKIGQADYVPYQSQKQSYDASTPSFAQVGQQDYVPHQAQKQTLAATTPSFAQVGQQDYVTHQDQKQTLAANTPSFAQVGQQDYVPHQAKPGFQAPQTPAYQMASQQSVGPTAAIPKVYAYNDLKSQVEKYVGSLKTKTNELTSAFSSQKEEIMGMIEMSFESMDDAFRLFAENDYALAIEKLEEAIDIYNSVPGWNDVVLKIYDFINYLYLKQNLLESGQFEANKRVLESSIMFSVNDKNDLISQKLSATNSILMKIESMISEALDLIDQSKCLDAIKQFNTMIVMLTSIGWDAQTHQMQLIVNDLLTITRIEDAMLTSKTSTAEIQSMLAKKQEIEIQRLDSESQEILDVENQAQCSLRDAQSALESLNFEKSVLNFDNTLNSYIKINRNQQIGTIFSVRKSVLNQKQKGLREKARISKKLYHMQQSFGEFQANMPNYSKQGATIAASVDTIMREAYPLIYEAFSMVLSGNVIDAHELLKSAEKTIGTFKVSEQVNLFNAIVKEMDEAFQIYEELDKENKGLKDTLRKQSSEFFEKLSKQSSTLSLQSDLRKRELMQFQTSASVAQQDAQKMPTQMPGLSQQGAPQMPSVSKGSMDVLSNIQAMLNQAKAAKDPNAGIPKKEEKGVSDILSMKASGEKPKLLGSILDTLQSTLDKKAPKKSEEEINKEQSKAAKAAKEMDEFQKIIEKIRGKK